MTWTKTGREHFDDFVELTPTLDADQRGRAVLLDWILTVWSSDRLSDGYVPQVQVTRVASLYLRDPMGTMRLLVDQGIWSETSRSDAPGYQRVIWDQPPAEQVRARAKAHADSQRVVDERKRRHGRGDHRLCGWCQVVQTGWTEADLPQDAPDLPPWTTEAEREARAKRAGPARRKPIQNPTKANSLRPYASDTSDRGSDRPSESETESEGRGQRTRIMDLVVGSASEPARPDGRSSSRRGQSKPVGHDGEGEPPEPPEDWDEADFLLANPEEQDASDQRFELARLEFCRATGRDPESDDDFNFWQGTEDFAKFIAEDKKRVWHQYWQATHPANGRRRS